MALDMLPGQAKSYWIWIAILLVVLGGIGFWMYRSMMPKAQPAEINLIKDSGTSQVAAKPTPSIQLIPVVTTKASQLPTATPTPAISITNVQVIPCTSTASCYGWLTNIRVTGNGFASDSRAKLIRNGASADAYIGSYLGGDGSKTILTDFVNLPRCARFDVYVTGSSGSTTSPNSVASACP